MKISIVRGAFLNPAEMQNFYPLRDAFDLQAISSYHPLSDQIDMPLVKLPSPTDLPNFPYKFPILNRLFTDAHMLFGLENKIAGSDIVHVAETYYHYTNQAIKAKQKGLVKKVISTVWEVIPHNNEGIRGRGEFKKLALKNIDHFIAVTDLARQALISEGSDPAQISVVPMGVDLKRFKPVAKPRPQAMNLLSVARLVSEKGIDTLVKAFQILHSKNPQLTLTLVGSGPLAKKIKGQPGIILKSLPYFQIQKAYQDADIFILLSRKTKYWQEQYGMVLVEAMASGLPIVTSDTGAIREVCSGVAVYTSPNNPHQVAASVSSLLSDFNLRSIMASSSRQRAEKHYNHQNIAEQIAKIYQEVAK